jgi:cupin fold WbuC family metalloprotein
VLVHFDETGRVTAHHRLAADEPDIPFFARMNTPTWHTCISSSPEVVFVETKLGPHEGTVYASWAHAADDGAASKKYFGELCAACGIQP